MDQQHLFVDDLLTALHDVVRALGGNKVVGAMLKRELAPDTAGQWLANCLKDGRREHLTPDQVMWLLREGRQIGCHTAMAYLCEQAGYASPVPVEPQDEMAEFQRQYIAAVKAQEQLVKRMEKLAPMLRVA